MQPDNQSSEHQAAGDGYQSIAFQFEE